MEGALSLTADMLSSREGPNMDSCANFFIHNLGSKEAATDFLEAVINRIDPLYMRKKRSITDMLETRASGGSKVAKVDGEGQIDQVTTSSDPAEVTGDFNFDILNGIHFNDAVDECMITFAIQVSNDKGMISNMIGKQGENITDIRSRTGVKTMLENMKVPLKDRAVFFCGKLKATLAAYQLMLKRMVQKAEERSQLNPLVPHRDVANEPLIIIFPNELCSRLIGKAGSTIKQLQATCGAKTSMESEDQMKGVHSFGRRIVVIGTPLQKLHAAYLTLRFLAGENYKDLPPSWKGHGLQPLPMAAPPTFPGFSDQRYTQVQQTVSSDPYRQPPPPFNHQHPPPTNGRGQVFGNQLYGQKTIIHQQIGSYPPSMQMLQPPPR